MHLFEIVSLNSEVTPPLHVFAPNYDTAVQVYIAWWVYHDMGDLADLEVRKRNVSWPGLNPQLLANALALGISGIGELDPQRGWRIVSPDCEHIGGIR
jgi:hypothetical protein